jgi:hypothetical protein
MVTGAGLGACSPMLDCRGVVDWPPAVRALGVPRPLRDAGIV